MHGAQMTALFLSCVIFISLIEIVDRYKYLGVMLHEHLDYDIIADLLASAAVRALGAVILCVSRACTPLTVI